MSASGQTRTLDNVRVTSVKLPIATRKQHCEAYTARDAIFQKLGGRPISDKLPKHCGYKDRRADCCKNSRVDDEKAETPSNKSVEPRLVRRGRNRRPDHYDAQRNTAEPKDEPNGTKSAD